MVMLSAEPSDIRAWRLRDEANTGRKRNSEVLDITADQDQNIARFRSLASNGSIPEGSKVINNNHGSIEATRKDIEEIFRTRS
tara:strand:- start:351 stop:599 length:249 start_codon:yes stop_codon:yes gene_type:complete